jgi:hypothetical protein
MSVKKRQLLSPMKNVKNKHHCILAAGCYWFQGRYKASVSTVSIEQVMELTVICCVRCLRQTTGSACLSASDLISISLFIHDLSQASTGSEFI